jgi:hypothetical protein
VAMLMSGAIAATIIFFVAVIFWAVTRREPGPPRGHRRRHTVGDRVAARHRGAPHVTVVNHGQ